MFSPIRSDAGRALMASALAGVLCLTATGRAQQTNRVVIDASSVFREPGPARYDETSGRSPSGRVIGVNSRYLTIDGKPWLPSMGEFHFSRYPSSRWEEEILKMKAAGVDIIATYVIWIHHEEVRGQFDWTGQRDLRAFARLCQKHGMYLVVRIGPWAHGEVRNGGFPDWVVKQGNTRRNDPYYLDAVRAWYRQIGQQLNGMMWKDGGPIIGVQLENEYSLRGAGAGDMHILELKKLARASGLDVPLYFVTAWDNAVIPEGAVLPVHDGYPDAPWDASLEPWPAPEAYAFRLRSRVAANLPSDGTLRQSVPFLTAEMGGGIEDTYHRRPIISADDVAAIVPVMLGSGVNLYGTYMFQGGENPDGKLSTLEESQVTGYPNDVPVKSYDFQAPLGEFGQERPSLRKLKVFQYFLHDFGAVLAPMSVSAAANEPKNPADLSVLRATVRSRGNSGFLFVNNYIRGTRMPSRPGTQFDIRLPGGTLQFPRQPVDIPSGAYFIWPFNLSVDGITLRYATAQLFTRIENAGTTTLFFAAEPGVPVEFAIDETRARIDRVGSGTVTHENGVTYVSGIQPGVGVAIDLVSASGAHVRLVTLTHPQAENAWKVRTAGEERLLITTQDFFWNPDADSPRIWLRGRRGPQFSFTLMPAPPSLPRGTLPLHRTATGSGFASFTAQAQTANWDLRYVQTQPGRPAPPVKLGPVTALRSHAVAEAPPGSAFAHAAKWSLAVPAGSMQGLSDLFLSVLYTGDEARLYGGGDLLTDNFYNGERWNVGLERFCKTTAICHLELDVLPFRGDAPVYIQSPYRPAGGDKQQTVKIEDMRLIPEYQLVIDAQ